MFKLGDRVEVVGKNGRTVGSRPIGYVGVVTSTSTSWCGDEGGIYYLDNGNGSYESELRLVNSKNIIMNIVEKFKNSFIQEPERTFKKAGITNGDGILTSDGRDIFFAWLLKQNADKFKAEVVDELIKEEDK